HYKASNLKAFPLSTTLRFTASSTFNQSSFKMYIDTSKLTTVALATILSVNSVIGAPIAGRSSTLLTRDPRGGQHSSSGGYTVERVSSWTGALSDITGMGADAATIAEAANNQKRSPKGHSGSSSSSGDKALKGLDGTSNAIGIGA